MKTLLTAFAIVLAIPLFSQSIEEDMRIMDSTYHANFESINNRLQYAGESLHHAENNLFTGLALVLAGGTLMAIGLNPNNNTTPAYIGGAVVVTGIGFTISSAGLTHRAGRALKGEYPKPENRERKRLRDKMGNWAPK